MSVLLVRPERISWAEIESLPGKNRRRRVLARAGPFCAYTRATILELVPPGHLGWGHAPRWRANSVGSARDSANVICMRYGRQRCYAVAHLIERYGDAK